MAEKKILVFDAEEPVDIVTIEYDDGNNWVNITACDDTYISIYADQLLNALEALGAISKNDSRKYKVKE